MWDAEDVFRFLYVRPGLLRAAVPQNRIASSGADLHVPIQPPPPLPPGRELTWPPVPRGLKTHLQIQANRLRPRCAPSKEQFGHVRSNQGSCWNVFVSCFGSFIQRNSLKYQLGFSCALEKNVSSCIRPSDLNRKSLQTHLSVRY